MAEFVHLPIYDEDGFDTGKILKIDTRHYLGAAAGLANRYMEIVEGPDVAEEMELINNIIDGREVRSYEVKKTDPVEVLDHGYIHSISLEKESPSGSIELVDFASAYPPGEWMTIPRYTDWEINTLTHEVRNKESKEVVKVLGEDTQNPYVPITFERRNAPVVMSWIVAQIPK